MASRDYLTIQPTTQHAAGGMGERVAEQPRIVEHNLRTSPGLFVEL